MVLAGLFVRAENEDGALAQVPGILEKGNDGGVRSARAQSVAQHGQGMTVGQGGAGQLEKLVVLPAGPDGAGKNVGHQSFTPLQSCMAPSISPERIFSRPALR